MDTPTLCNAISQPDSGQEAEQLNPRVLSKNAQKRAAKAVRLRELKIERRVREKEAKKNKRRERAQAIARGDLDENATPKMRKVYASGSGETEIFNARVVVDLGFDDLMLDKEINSLTSQLAYTYSANRRAPLAFSVLIFTSLNGRTKHRLDAMNDAGYKRWSKTEWWEEGYDRLWAMGIAAQSPTEDSNTQGSSMPSPRVDRQNVVYLTADSPEELLELNEGEVYIIGGICDHNRYKNLCLNKAIGSQIRHARLPIGRYMSLATRKVLTVNQVFEILLKWIGTRNWEEAFWAVIPKRKFGGRASDEWQDQQGEGKEGTTMTVTEHLDEDEDEDAMPSQAQEGAITTSGT